MRRFVAAVNERNLNAISDLVADDIVGGDGAEEIHGLDAFRDEFTNFHESFPDLRYTVDDWIAEGDKVAYRWTARGTHQGEYMGIAPTGKTVTATGITIDRIADGKIAEHISSWDALGMLQQLGVLSHAVDGQE